jgi:hypothetical protein
MGQHFVPDRALEYSDRLYRGNGAGGISGAGRDVDGRYKDSPLHDWFEHLASGKGLCCSYADGYVIQDADWGSKDGHYRVRVPKAANSEDMTWIDVPDEAVITEPNKVGQSMVWPRYGFGGVSIRCFMPGSMT